MNRLTPRDILFALCVFIVLFLLAWIIYLGQPV